MNYPDSPHDQLPETDWQTLGKLQLGVDSSPNGTINQWLIKILDPFLLSEDYVSKILTSIEDAAVRVLSPDTEEGKVECLDIVILTPASRPSNQQTWGFFRLERMENDANPAEKKSYRIEYYLYPERTS